MTLLELEIIYCYFQPPNVHSIDIQVQYMLIYKFKINIFHIRVSIYLHYDERCVYLYLKLSNILRINYQSTIFGNFFCVLLLVYLK